MQLNVCEHLTTRWEKDHHTAGNYFSNITDWVASLAFKLAHKALFHSGVYCSICKMKQFNIKKLFVTQACLHVSVHAFLVL